MNDQLPEGEIESVSVDHRFYWHCAQAGQHDRHGYTGDGHYGPGGYICDGTPRRKETVTRDELLRSAYQLLGDGAGGEWTENREYSKAIFELLSDTLGYSEEQRDQLVIEVRHSGVPRSLGGTLSRSRQCARMRHYLCRGSWTSYPDQSGPCECGCHAKVIEPATINEVSSEERPGQ